MTDRFKQPARTQTLERWRVFCALELASEVRTLFIEHIARLRRAVPNAQATWSREQNIHLTLKFLGEVKPSQAARVSFAATHAVTDISPFQISIQETGVFAKNGNPRVLWLGVKDETGMLSRLQLRLEEACADEGFAREDRPFHPHLTIARLRKPHSANELADAHRRLGFEPVWVKIRELWVIRSELNRDGSIYRVISQHALEAKPRGS